MAEALAAPAPVASKPRNVSLVGAFMFAHFTHHVSNSMLTPLLPVIRDSFGLSYPAAGALVSAFSLSSGLSQPPIGVLADRIGSRTVITAGLFLTALCMILIGVAGEYWQLLTLLVALGVVAGTYHAPAASLLARAFPPETRGGALGMHTVGGNLSFFATPLVAGGLVAATQTWRTPYLLFAIAPIVAGIFLMLTAPRVRERSDGTSTTTRLFPELRGVFQVVGPLLGAAITMQMLYAALVAFLAIYLVDVHGFNAPAAAVMVSVPFIGGLLGSPLGGGLSDRLGRKPIIVMSLVGLGPLLVLLAWAPPILLVPILILIGLVGSLRYPVIEGWLLDRAPADRRATTLGAYYLIAQELGGLGAPILGLLAAGVGINQAFTAVAFLCAALSAFVLIFQRRL
jgi:FSR family fosmidomycin resistance protein-like MFS transporter